MRAIIRTMSKANPQFNIRMPDDLRAALEAEAERSGRSVGGEVIVRLRSSLAGSPADSEAARKLAVDVEVQERRARLAAAELDLLKRALRDTEDRLARSVELPPYLFDRLREQAQGDDVRTLAVRLLDAAVSTAGPNVVHLLDSLTSEVKALAKAQQELTRKAQLALGSLDGGSVGSSALGEHSIAADEADPPIIDTKSKNNLFHWSGKYHRTEAEIIAAVKAVGSDPAKVKAHLARKKK